RPVHRPFLLAVEGKDHETLGWSSINRSYCFSSDDIAPAKGRQSGRTSPRARGDGLEALRVGYARYVDDDVRWRLGLGMKSMDSLSTKCDAAEQRYYHLLINLHVAIPSCLFPSSVRKRGGSVPGAALGPLLLGATEKLAAHTSRRDGVHCRQVPAFCGTEMEVTIGCFNRPASHLYGDPMRLDYVTIEKRDAAAIIHFDRKQNLNAFNERLIAELTAVAKSFLDDVDTQVVILSGARNAFSAGFDLKATDGWISEKDDLKRRQRAYAGVRLCKAWEEMPQVTIAAMEKLAVGAGVAIALACDWRVLGRGAYLYVPEVKIGLNLQWGALPRLITLVGPARAKRITIMCEKMPASMALDWGLVDELAEDGQAVDKANAMAEVVLSMPAA